MKIVLYGNPITKKNSSRILKNGGTRFVAPSKQYKRYERDCLRQITGLYKKHIDYPVNVRVLYFMQKRYRVDLVNLLSATCDILVVAGVLSDDNYKIVVAHDGSRVLYDKENPRAEIYIEEIEEDKK